MKAALFDSIKHISVIDKDIPAMAEHEVLIKVICTGICGSEIHAFNGSHPFRKPPSILGHEVVGRIQKAGLQVKNVAVGDLVTIEPHLGCDKCSYCADGDYHLCKQKVILGTTRWEGAFAEYVVAPERTVYKLPPEMSPQLAVLAEPLAVGVHAAKVANIKKGDKVAVLGSGPIGLLTAVAAHNAGAEIICITDAIDRNLEVGLTLGATHAVNVRKEPISDYVLANIGEMDTVFLTVGIKSVVHDALSIVKRKGKIISIALFEEEVPVNLNQFMISEIQMFGSSMYTKEDFIKAIDIIKSERFALEQIVTHHFAFHDVLEAMNTASSKKDSPIKVLIDL